MAPVKNRLAPAVQEKKVGYVNPSPAAEVDNMESEVFYYRPWWFVRAMILIAWCAFRHPFSTSTIDLRTGRVSRAGEGK